MRTHAERSSSGRSPSTQKAPPATRGRATDTSAGVPEVRTPDDAASLQRSAGNRATVEAIRSGAVVQRAVTVQQADAIARRLHDAMEGWGTDEEAVYGALSGRTPGDVEAIRDAYLRLYDTTLQSDIDDEFSGDELARANRLLQGSAAPAENATPAEKETATTRRAGEIAAHLKEAMEGWGTEEDEIFNALEGRTAAELSEIAREYATLTGHALEVDLRDELSGGELERALSLLGVVRSDVFTNEIEQNMTEGKKTVVKGRFEWALTRDELRAEAGVKFLPDEGVTPPYAAWNDQISRTWNKYAVREPGGRSLPVNLSLRADSSADRTIQVHNNADASKWWLDRANAGEWYVKMKDSTAPHEFGHLIGLPDEYQRTHGDITKITGSAPAAGTANASTKTPEQIATEIHAALIGEARDQRAANVTTALKAVGLINADGDPQQGDFAQSVLKAYDKAYSPGLVATMRDNLDRDGRWTIQTVFSYATRTIMGDPGGLGQAGALPDPHDHSVEPRHLAEFARLVKSVWPQFDWTIGTR